MRTAIISLVVALGGCADEVEDLLACDPEGDCFFTGAEWEDIESLAMLEPLPLPEPAFGDRQAYAESLGRAIFFDDGLGPHGVSCASCHPFDGWLTSPATRREPGAPQFRGITTAIDVVYYPWHKWDGSKLSVAATMMGAIEGASLIDGNRLEVVRHVYETPYAAALASFAPRPAGLDDIPLAKGKPGMPEWDDLGVEWNAHKAEVDAVFATLGTLLEAYLRTMVSTPSAFDEYVAGDFDRLDEAEKRGLRLFIGKGHCIECHSGPRLTDDGFHNIGLAIEPEPSDRKTAVAKLVQDDPEGFGDLDPDDPTLEGAFRTPSLRNVAMTPPYMHTSEYETLDDVVWHYMNTTEARVGGLDGRMWETDLTDAEAEDLVAFLETLTSTSCPWMPGDVCPPPPR